MKETPLSLCERKFILEAVKNNQRIDGRQPYDIRVIRIFFGVDRGSCQVFLGKTRVLAQVSCEITSPKPSRPTEGLLHVNLELSPMAAPHYEAGRLSAYGVEINRLLERTLCESRCIDLESLCIIAGEKVWSVRIDVHVLDDDGSLADCTSIAAITALSHFRRPAVTVSGENITILPPEERDSVPLCVYHMPVCATFAFFDTGKQIVLDPNDLEQRVSDGKMILGMTAHQEICSLHLSGNILLRKDQVLKCANIASKKISEVIDTIKTALDKDAEKRVSGIVDSFAQVINPNSILEYEQETTKIKFKDTTNIEEIETIEPNVTIITKGIGTVQTGEEKPCTWDISDEDVEMEVETVKVESKPKKSQPKKVETIELSEDSEEDEVMILNPEFSETKGSSPDKSSRGWYGDSWPST